MSPRIYIEERRVIEEKGAVESVRLPVVDIPDGGFPLESHGVIVDLRKTAKGPTMIVIADALQQYDDHSVGRREVPVTRSGFGSLDLSSTATLVIEPNTQLRYISNEYQYINTRQARISEDMLKKRKYYADRQQMRDRVEQRLRDIREELRRYL